MSVSATSSSAIARTERVVCFTASFARGSSGRSLIQQTRASSSRATIGGRLGSARRGPAAGAPPARAAELIVLDPDGPIRRVPVSAADPRPIRLEFPAT